MVIASTAPVLFMTIEMIHHADSRRRLGNAGITGNSYSSCITLLVELHRDEHRQGPGGETETIFCNFMLHARLVAA